MFSKKAKSQPCWHRFIAISLFFIYFILLAAPTGAVGLDGLNNSCVDCHKKLSPFTDEQSRFNEIRLNHTERNISCSLECHEDVIRKRASDNFQQWSDSAHSEYYVTCDACHGGDPTAITEAGAHAAMKNVSDPNSSIYFKNIPDTCGKCHAEELDHFKNTMHYQRLRAESRAPSCITCHQPHTFKVLKAAELTTVCSVCHNQKDNIATPTVPNDAKQALEKQNELQGEILNAKNIVAQAKAKGMDVSTAQMDVDAAVAVMNNAPSLWHGFNLKDFDTQIQSGIDYAKKAEYMASDAEPTVPRAPGIGIAFVLGIFALLYLIRKR
ncbi:Cytochrome c7 c [uncultured archaeon]|nr:Cytochrome c7 c [uncultured archaeon]